MDTDLFEVVSSKTISASRFEITEDDLRIADKTAKYSYVNIKPGICVIVETDEGFVVLKEYRYPIKQWSYEFVAGIIDEGEKPEEAAVRETLEETGYIAEKVVSLGEFYPSFGATNELIYLFYAQCTGKTVSATEETEFITYETMSKNEVENLIKCGQFKHGAGLAAWLRYLLKQ